MNEPTREARRLALLVRLLEEQGHPDHEGPLNVYKIARIVGMDASHLHKIVTVDRPRGLGADIIRKMREGLRIDPAFFFDENEPTELGVYYLGKKRIATAIALLEQQNAILLKRIEALEAERNAVENGTRTGPQLIRKT